MRQAIALFLIGLWAGSLPAFAQAPTAKDPYDLSVKKIYAETDESSKLVYEIPIEVKLLDISEDGNWYKVKIAFDLGILGKYKYAGWTYIPVQDLLESRLKEKAKIAAAPK